MNSSLYRSLLKTNLRTILSYAAGSVMYLALLVWVFPSIAGSSGINDMLKNLPENMQKMFGLEGGIQSLTDYLAADYYGLLYVIIMMVFSIMTAVQLVARLVDQGSMAYLLATPVSRGKIAGTQAAVLLSGLFLICLLTMLGGLFAPQVMLDNPEIDQARFVEVNVVAFLLFAVVSGYSFLFSCALNDEKQALGASAVVTVLFYAMNLIGRLSDEFAWLKQLSLFNAFNPQEIVRGEVDLLPVCLGLGAGAVVLYALAIYIFKKRDLPL